MATRTLAPVTSFLPELWTWIAALCITLWKPVVGTDSVPSTWLIKLPSSFFINSVTFFLNASKSTLQAFITLAASGSSIKASSKCSSVVNSCLWSFAIPNEVCIQFSNDFEKDGIFHLFLFICLLVIYK